jgi:hypothetical protein
MRALSVFLSLVIGIVILHNAVPHHHHEEIPVLKHDDACNSSEHHAGKGHLPASCRLNSVDFDIPRSREIKPEVTHIDHPAADWIPADEILPRTDAVISWITCNLPSAPLSVQPARPLSGRAPPRLLLS